MWTAAIIAGGLGRRHGSVNKGAPVVAHQSIIDRPMAMVHPLTPHIFVGARHEWQPPSNPAVDAVVEGLLGLTVRHIGPDKFEPYDGDGRPLLNVSAREDDPRAQAR